VHTGHEGNQVVAIPKRQLLAATVTGLRLKLNLTVRPNLFL
jgi:hypothetical protein